MSGGKELSNCPIDAADFRPKDMTVRRSRMIESLDPITMQNTSDMRA